MAQHKVVKKGPAARDAFFAGMQELADHLAVAIGPYGLNMASGVRGGDPHISNDAKEIADQVNSKDEIRDVGVRHLRSAINKANDFAGNGRKSCAILCNAIGKAIIRLLPTEKMSLGRMSLLKVTKQVEAETAQAVDILKSLATPITSEKQLIDVAITASESEEIGQIIGSAQWKLGKDGHVVVEDSNQTKTTIEYVKGIKIDNGFGTSVMVNDAEKQIMEVSNAHVLLTTHVIHTFDTIKNLIDSLSRARVRRLIVIARAFTPEAIKESLEYQKRGFGIYPVNAPYTNQDQVMLDLAAISGATFIGSEERDLADIQVSDIGVFSSLQASRWSTQIAGSDSDKVKKLTAERIAILEKEYKGEESVFMKNGIEERIAQLKSGFAVVKIGSLSSGGKKYKLDKTKDAIKTVKGALQENVVPGGGLALKMVSEKMPEGSIIKDALKAPYEQIMANAGEDFDIPDTVQDSLKVVRVGLEYASEIALTGATVGIAINHENEKPRFVQEAVQNTDTKA
jgi:chaperonin GroEL